MKTSYFQTVQENNMPFDPLWALLFALLALNAYASYLVCCDETPATPQFWAQMALVWLVPLLGAALIVFVKGMQEATPSTWHGRDVAGDSFPGQEGSIHSADGGGAGGGGD